MRIRKLPDSKTLTDRQKYLLNRMPSEYQLDGFKSPPEPKEVKRARSLVERWDKRISLAKCQQKQRSLALLRKARESVYFASEDKALAIVRQVEKLLKGCQIS